LALKRVSSAQGGLTEKLKTVLESSGNNNMTMFLNLFCDDCEGNDDVKRPTTPDLVCMTKQAVAGS
jgi:hypothetical protein